MVDLDRRMSEEMAGLAPLPARLLSEPLDYILADHLRHRCMCRLLDLLAAAAAFDRELGRLVADHVRNDMAVHVVDEEEDLFPTMRRRAEPEDQIEQVLGLLSREHAAEERLGRAVVAALDRALAGGATTLDAAARVALRDFAAGQRRHLAVENAIVMPIAKRRLTRRDLAGLSRRMAARRGIDISHLAP